MRRTLAVALALSLAAVATPQRAGAGAFRFTHGVAAGDVNGDGVLLWTRAGREARVTAQVATDRRFRDVVARVSRNARKERNLTVEVRVNGLLASDEYFYRFVGPGGVTSPVGRFRTPPGGSGGSGGVARRAVGERPVHESERTPRSEVATFVYSGDSDGTVTEEGVDNFRDEIASVMGAMRTERADFMVWLGDTIYSDSGLAAAPASTLGRYRAKYREVRSIRSVRNMLASTSLVAQWDDHEVVNDYAPVAAEPFGPWPADLTPGRVAAGQRAFREYFPIREGPGGITYRSFLWGSDVEVFVLDERSYRSTPVPAFEACDQDGTPGAPYDVDLAPTLPQFWREQFVDVRAYFADPPPPGCVDAIRAPGRAFLGPEQKQWLKDSLVASTATFKVVVNEVPIQQLYALPYDRWEGYEAERLEVLNFIRDQGITGVFFATTDTHATIGNRTCDVTLSEADGSYVCDRDVWPWELVSGPFGTNTYAAEVESVAPGASGDVANFFKFVLKVPCLELDQPSYGLVEMDPDTGILTATSRKPTDAGPVDICSIEVRA